MTNDCIKNGIDEIDVLYKKMIYFSEKEKILLKDLYFVQSELIRIQKEIVRKRKK